MSGTAGRSNVGFTEEFKVAFSTGEDDVDPYTHGLSCGCHQVEGTFIRFDTERHTWVWTLDRVQVVHIDLLYGLKWHTTLQLGFSLVAEVHESPSVTVKDKPTLLPRAPLATQLV